MIYNKTKIHKSYNFLINIILLLGAYFFIYYQLFYNKDLESITTFLQLQIQKPDILKLLTIVVILMPVNWILESFKWQYLIRKTEKLSLFKSFRCILTGITTSIFTPNRIGDFIGKVFMLKKANHWKAAFISILGSISQLLITFFIGSICFLIIIAMFLNVLNSDIVSLFYGFVFIIIILNLLFFMFYFKVSFVTGFISKLIPISWVRLKEYLGVLSHYSTSELTTVLLFSLMRYLVFNFQLFLLFKIFSINLSLAESFMMSSCIFFILSFIPSIALAEIGIRGSVAIAVFSIYYNGDPSNSDHYKLGAVTAVTVLWLINVIIPAFAGSFFILKLRFFRKSIATK